MNPTATPFPPHEKHEQRLEEWLLQHFSATAFNTTRNPLPVIEGEPHRIHLMPNAVPHACHTPASVLKHWEDEVKAQPEEEVERGVIEPIPAGEPMEWCAHMVVVAKKPGQPRRTVDYQRLNTACRRETHHTPVPLRHGFWSPQALLQDSSGCLLGYHQVELDKESLTTFITPWGHFRYLRTPMGHCSAGDAYTKRFDDAIQGIGRKYKCVDDTLLYDSLIERVLEGLQWKAALVYLDDVLVLGSTFEEELSRLEEVLRCLRAANLKLSPKKCTLFQLKAPFLGHVVGRKSVYTDPLKVTAVAGWPVPTDVTGVRSFLGIYIYI